VSSTATQTSAKPVAGSNEIPSCHGGLENLDEEYAYRIEDIEGDVPADLRGTFFRNGPGRQRIGDSQYGHWFDGDGMLCSFSFNESGVDFRNRYVRTPKYIDETAAQAVRYRGFGTQVPGGLRKNFLKMPANPANTNTIWHGGHLLALNEGGKPWKVDPTDLSTVGEFTYDGGIKSSEVFSAHGKIHPRTGDYINYGAGMSGMSMKGPKPCLHLYRIDSAGKLFKRQAVPLDNFPFCHDFALTDKYAVFFLGSIVFGNMLPVVLGTRTISDQVTFDPQIPMQVVVVDLDTLEEVKRFQTDPGAMIHFGNAFDRGDEIVIDGMYASDFEANDTLTDVFNPDGRFNGGTYYRYTLNMATGKLAAEPVCAVESEFPTFNTAYTGKQHGVTYTACSINNGANSFFNAIQRITYDGDGEVVELPKGTYGSEPLFAPAQNAKAEDDGYVLEVVYDGWTHKSELQVYRADNIHEHCCTLRLKHHIPHQFHGHFTTELFA